MGNMPILEDASFDDIVCYGAALSYTCERYAATLKELARVLRTGGRLLISVASLYGTLRLVGPYDARSFLESPDAHLEWGAVLSGRNIVNTRPGSAEFHQPLVLFTSAGLQDVLAHAGFRVVAMASANPLVPESTRIPNITTGISSSASLTALELSLCEHPGLIETGEHLLSVGEKA
jgi:SAM-dependent methyltransferase